MAVKIRPCREEDFADVLSLYQELHDLHQTSRPDLYAMSENPITRSQYAAAIQNDQEIWLAAEEHGFFLGFCQAAIRTPQSPLMVKRSYAYVDAICVHPYNRNKGVAQHLYDALVEKAKELSLNSVQLMVWSFNDPALKFYEKQGMETICRIMEKKL